ncbi:MAG: alpha/beta hydrolase [Rhodoferax sp.]|nr:alpha/beta hydrolase [Rhodoferax sp.]
MTTHPQLTPQPQPVTQPQPLTLQTLDGVDLQALRYRARGEVRGRIVVAGATGVPQHFYRHFADYAAQQGYDTLTVDYRGIGLSKSGGLRGFQMDYLDWAFQDVAAAVDAMADEHLALFMVGHSFGGHAFGVLPNHHKVAKLYTFGTGAGWHGWMPRAEQIKVWCLWNVVGPALTRYKGYLAWSKLGMGEDLPLGVYRDWKRWCKFPRYFFDDPGMAHIAGLFGRVRAPIVAANATDDLWALPASRDAFMAAYCNTTVQTVDIRPPDHALGPIGHMGYFRRQAQPLWHEVLDWFASNPAHAPR